MARRIKHCPICNNNVSVKSISIFWFIFWFLMGGFPAIIYVLLRLRGKCPVCRAKI